MTTIDGPIAASPATIYDDLEIPEGILQDSNLDLVGATRIASRLIE